MKLMLHMLLAGWLALRSPLSSTPKPQAPPDVNGTWTWSAQRQNGGGREVTGKLTQHGEKVTGTVSGTGFGNGEMDITDGTIKDGAVSFKIIRTRGGQDFVTVYSGKLQGDVIKGTIQTDMRGQKVQMNWDAKRLKEEPDKTGE